MANSGIKHIDVGLELTKTEWESEDIHELIHGTSFPSSPVERQLFYRDDEHKWYIYNGSAWVDLQGTGGGVMEVHGNEYHDPDFASEVALSSHAAANTGVHGAGPNYLAHTGTIKEGVTPLAGEILRQQNFTASPPFTGTVKSGITSTSVPYTPISGEGSLIGIYSGPDYWGRIMLYNSTRGSYRKIVSVDTTNDIITTEASTDNWTNGDSITTQSQTNTTAGFIDLDLSANVPATTFAIWLSVLFGDYSGSPDSLRSLISHPFKAYDLGLRCYAHATLGNEVTTVVIPLEVVSQKITIYPRNVTDSTIVLACKGVMKTPQ